MLPWEGPKCHVSESVPVVGEGALNIRDKEPVKKGGVQV